MLLSRLIVRPKPLNINLHRSLVVRSILQPHRLVKFTVGTTLLTGLGFVSYTIYESGLEWEKIRRTSYFWSRMIPVYLHYRYQQMYFQLFPAKTPDEDQVWLKLHNKYYDYVLDVLFFINVVFILKYGN